MDKLTEGQLTREQLTKLSLIINYQDIFSEDFQKMNLGSIANKILKTPNYYLPPDIELPVEMSQQEWIKAFEYIKADPQLSKLEIANKVDEKTKKNLAGHRAAYFVDRDSKIGTVVFRGTSGDDGWIDNGRGLNMEISPQQQAALDFAKECHEMDESYIMTVTGQSKGGNKAQICAILLPFINNCVSVDGQGFSDKFMEKYAKEISENRDKIKLIAEYGDYVHCLGNQIKETEYYNGYRHSYLENTPFGDPLHFFHIPEALLDSNGKLIPMEKQSVPPLAKVLNKLTTTLVNNPEYDNVQDIAAASIMDFLVKGKEKKLSPEAKVFGLQTVARVLSESLKTDAEFKNDFKAFLSDGIYNDQNAIKAIVYSIMNGGREDTKIDDNKIPYADKNTLESLEEDIKIFNCKIPYDSKTVVFIDKICEKLLGEPDNLDAIVNIIENLPPDVLNLFDKSKPKSHSIMPVLELLNSDPEIREDVFKLLLDSGEVLVDVYVEDPNLKEFLNGVIDKAKVNPELRESLFNVLDSIGPDLVQVIDGKKDWKDFAIDVVTKLIFDKDFRDALGTSLGELVTTMASSAWDMAKVPIGDFIDGAIEKVGSAIGWISDGLGNGYNWVKNIAVDGYNAIKNKLGDIGNYIKTQASNCISKIEDIGSWFTGKLDNAKDYIMGKIKNIDMAISNGIDSVVKSLKGFTQSMVNESKNFLNGIKEKWNQLSTNINEKISDIKATGKEILDNVKNSLSSFKDAVVNGGATLYKNISGKISDVGSSAVSFISGLVDSGKKKVNGLINKATDIISSKGKNTPPNKLSIPDSNGSGGNTNSKNIKVDLNELNRLYQKINNLCSVIKNTPTPILSEANNVANSATQKYNQGYVYNTAQQVKNYCSAIEKNKNIIYDELSKISNGLKAVKKGYESLESNL